MSNVVATSSPVANAVISGLAGDVKAQLGAVMLRGHLLAFNACGVPAISGEDEHGNPIPDDTTNDYWRLYDDTFTHFVEFKRADLLAHQPGDSTGAHPMGLVWLRFEAVTLSGRTGEASSLAGGGDGGWHRPPGGWHRPPGGWHRPPGGMDDPGDWHRPPGG